MKEKFDFEQFSKDLVDSVKNGRSLTGIGGVFPPAQKSLCKFRLDQLIGIVM